MMPGYSDLHEHQHPDWDYLDLTYSEFGRPIIQGTTVRVPARHVDAIAGFPGHEQSQLYSQCTLVFSGVVSSTRQISEHIGKGRKGFKPFKPEYVVDDGPFPESQAQVFMFPLDGWSYDPDGSIWWEIVAESVHIEDGIKQEYSYRNIDNSSRNIDNPSMETLHLVAFGLFCLLLLLFGIIFSQNGN